MPDVKRTIAIPAGLHAKLRVTAAIEDRSQHAVIIDAIELYLQGEPTSIEAARSYLERADARDWEADTSIAVYAGHVAELRRQLRRVLAYFPAEGGDPT
jgi:hypothetical protein